jgi:hypothetical protein
MAWSGMITKISGFDIGIENLVEHRSLNGHWLWLQTVMHDINHSVSFITIPTF